MSDSSPATAIVAALDETRLDEVIRLRRGLLVVFTADWCASCHALVPVLDELAVDVHPTVTVVTVDVGEHPRLGERFGVQTLPTMILFADGQAVGRIDGARGKQQLLRYLRQTSQDFFPSSEDR